MKDISSFTYPSCPSSRGGKDRGERLPGSKGALASCPCAKKTTQKKPNTRIFWETRKHIGREKRRKMEMEGLTTGESPRGRQRPGYRPRAEMRGANGHGKRWQMQEHGAGRRYERRRLVGGKSGRRPGGHCYAPG